MELKTYEAMFLFDPTNGEDWQNVETQVQTIMNRAEAELVLCKKWDEGRRLSYEINGRKRGVYVLTYFRVEPDRIAGIERDVGLAEPILRVLVTCADGMTDEDIQKAAEAEPPPPPPTVRFGEGSGRPRYGDQGGHRRRFDSAGDGSSDDHRRSDRPPSKDVRPAEAPVSPAPPVEEAPAEPPAVEAPREDSPEGSEPTEQP